MRKSLTALQAKNYADTHRSSRYQIETPDIRLYRRAFTLNSIIFQAQHMTTGFPTIQTSSDYTPPTSGSSLNSSEPTSTLMSSPTLSPPGKKTLATAAALPSTSPTTRLTRPLALTVIESTVKETTVLQDDDMWTPDESEVTDWLQPDSASTSVSSPPASTSALVSSSLGATSTSTASSSLSTGITHYEPAKMPPEKIREALLAQFRKLTDKSFDDDALIKEVSKKLIALYKARLSGFGNITYYSPEQTGRLKYFDSQALDIDNNIQVFFGGKDGDLKRFTLGDNKSNAVVFTFSKHEELFVFGSDEIVKGTKFDLTAEPDSGKNWLSRLLS